MINMQQQKGGETPLRDEPNRSVMSSPQDQSRIPHTTDALSRSRNLRSAVRSKHVRKIVPRLAAL